MWGEDSIPPTSPFTSPHLPITSPHTPPFTLPTPSIFPILDPTPQTTKNSPTIHTPPNSPKFSILPHSSPYSISPVLPISCFITYPIIEYTPKFPTFLIHCHISPAIKPVSLVAKGTLSAREVWDSIRHQIDTVSSTARHRCDVSSEQCCPGAKPRHSLRASASYGEYNE